MKNKNVLFVVRVIIITALLVVTQLLSKVIPSVPIWDFNLKYLIGDVLFNLIIVYTAAVYGLSYSAVGAIAAPIISVLLSLTPTKIPAMVAVIIAGNIMLAFIVWVCFRASKGLSRVGFRTLQIIGVAAGAFMKLTAMQYITEKIVIPYLMPSASVSASLSAQVTVNVVIYALIGGALALLMIPLLKNVLRTR